METKNMEVTTGPNVGMKEFLKDLAFTAGFALLTGGTVSLGAALVIVLLAR